jgi:VCBS repeat-containing protein
MSNSAAVIGVPSVQTVTEDSNPQTLVAAGSISISDANAGQAAFKTTVIAASGDLGSLTIAASGAYVYSVADSKVQYLGAGDTKVDTFTVTSLDGTTKQVAFTIIGVNDAAVIGAPTVVDVTEDATSPTLKATGSISVSDVDQNQAAFKTAVISALGNLGTLVLQSNGSYTYSVPDSAVQYLGAGQVKTDTFTVTALDGTTRQISFNVHGTNDAAVIGTPTVHDVTEDATNPTLTAVGSISISDADQGQAWFKTSVISASGNLGNLVIAANGTYTYSVADSAVQYLGAGQTKVDTFTVTSLDGTTKQVSFTIHGTNDAAVIGTPTAHDVTEDATNPIIYAIGTVSISDADQGQAAFQPTLQAGNGNLGALIMGSNGAYIYAVLDSAVQYLGAGDTKVDTFTLTALDGTQKQVTFTIHGANDAAIIGAPTVHDVTEDANVSLAGNLTAAGILSISDADQNQSSFQTTVAGPAGTLGHLSIAANGAYSYTVADSLVQYLGANDSKTETFTVTAFDGTQKQVSFTIHGTNDAAVIGTPAQHDVTKNASPVTLTASGILSITDADQNQASFQTAVVSASSNLGHLTIAASGTYTYSVANSATQFLGAADTKTDIFTVTALDGTQKQISFTIHGGSGANTPAVIGDPTNATVTEDVGGATLMVTGSIPVTDPDAGQAVFQTTVTPGGTNLGTLVLQSGGTYTYSVADSAVQYLGAGQSEIDTFTVTSVDGTQKVVSFTIQGANDPAVIGDPVAHTVTEDSGGATLTATGKLTVTDVDQNQSSFQAGSVAGATNLGTLSFAADGTYTYSVANSVTQFLGAADTRTDTFTVHSLDGTPKVISFTIQGTNDAAVISDPQIRDVTQDLNVSTTGNLTATGQLTATDPDQGQSSFQPGATGPTGNLGTLTLAADGTYTYSVANSATQSLGAGQTHTDVFTVHSLDGTPKTISFDVHGVNDAAVISDPTLHDVTEDAASTLSVSGQMTATDPDQGHPCSTPRPFRRQATLVT